jgi:hypothetical protein
MQTKITDQDLEGLEQVLAAREAEISMTAHG